MAEMRVSDPSRLHLKKELTQIRKAARVLRDPGTTSTWKSPLNSSRSAAAAIAVPGTSSALSATWSNNNLFGSGNSRQNGNTQVDSQFPFRVESNGISGNGKEKRVFLYNWKNQKSSSEKSALAGNVEEEEEDDDADDGSSWNQGSVDDSLSDARNAGDSKSDTYGVDDPSSTSVILRFRDANLESSGTPNIRRATGKKRKSKKNGTHLDLLSRYQQKEMILWRNSLSNRRRLKGHPSMALGLGRDDSVEQSDDTEDYSNSEDFRKLTGASPLLLKLKQKNWPHSSSKLLKASRKDDSSCTYSTPALSTSSYNRYVNRNPSTIGSWDATTTSLNDRDDEVDDNLDLPGRQGCGIPCYWTRRTPKHRGVCRSCCSPSLSDTLRRKGSSILCGGQSMYHRHRRSSSIPDKRRIASRSAQGILPLLTNSGDGRGGSSIGTVHSDDELSTNFGELDLEGLSRLDGRRWSSSCRSQDGLEIVALNGEGEEEGTPENIRSLSQKYRPIFFDELIGQNIVVQSLVNAVSRGRIAPVYLFQGPRGTGKTSTARIFAAALNCLATDEMKPCGYCRECTNFISGKSRDFWEVDGTNHKGTDRVRYILRNLSVVLPAGYTRYKVFVVDECHLLTSKAWLAFLKFLEDPPQRVVFILITTDLDNVPRTIQSRCQKFLFNKIKDGDIVARLKKISAHENLDVESEALDLIALNADGSLRDAETMLDQLSLLGKRITTSLVNELVGVISDEKLLELLELAMSSDTAETVKRARQLMDSGVDPIVLMSQLASLIMDIIAGAYSIFDAKCSNTFFGGRSLSEAELERLKQALKLLSEAEKRLRDSSERSTWFTATLLQLGSVSSPDLAQSGSSRRQSSKATEDDPSSISKEGAAYRQKSGVQYVSRKSTSPASSQRAASENSSHQGELLSQNGGYNSKLSHGQLMDSGGSAASHDRNKVGNTNISCRYLDSLDDIWAKCIERCHSKTLRQLLCAHGKLLSISEVEGVLVAYVAFSDGDIKSRAERFLSSITNSIEIVLQHNVEVRIILLPDGNVPLNCVKPIELSGVLKQAATIVATERDKRAASMNALDGFADLESHQESIKVTRGSLSDLESNLKGARDSIFQSTTRSPNLLVEYNAETGGTHKSRQDTQMQRIESIICEQRLETAWLQAAEKGTPGTLSHLKPEKNQVLPQEGIYHQSHIGSMNSSGLSSQHWEDELTNELKALKFNDGRELQKDRIGGKVDHYPISPSLLHHGSVAGSVNKDSLGYESGSGAGGCSGLLCWNTKKPPKSGKMKGAPVIRPHKSGRFSLFGECAKAKKTESRFRR